MGRIRTSRKTGAGRGQEREAQNEQRQKQGEVGVQSGGGRVMGVMSGLAPSQGKGSIPEQASDPRTPRYSWRSCTGQDHPGPC